MDNNRRLIRFSFLVFFATLLATPIANTHACDWDSETLLEERSRFPTALEIIIGKFPRHSKDYYRWRLQDRLEKRKTDPNNDLLLDDVAVSYEKLGRYGEAIEVARGQLERNPERYESLANLGTFMIHDGRLQDGLRYIEQAIEVNPDAHFGREKFQLILVKYLLSRSSEGSFQLPLAEQRFSDDRSLYLLPFCKFLATELGVGPDDHLTGEQFDAATKGILGMMRFSRHDSPVLLEALGELQERGSARQLAYRAYKSAALVVDDPDAKAKYERLASHVVSYSLASWRATENADVEETDIEADFLKEREDAAAWHAGLVADERKWIAAGDAVDERFNEKYRNLPEAINPDSVTEKLTASDNSGRSYHAQMMSNVIGLVLMCVVLVSMLAAALVVFAKMVRKKNVEPIQ